MYVLETTMVLYARLLAAAQSNHWQIFMSSLSSDFLELMSAVYGAYRLNVHATAVEERLAILLSADVDDKHGLIKHLHENTSAEHAVLQRETALMRMDCVTD